MTHPLHYVRFLLSKELNAFYVSIVLRSLAFSMVGIFVPLYLYKELGYGLSSIVFYYLIYSFLFGVLSFPSAWIVDKLSFRYIILICSPLYILYFVLLHFLKFNPSLFFIIPVVLGIVDALFWLAFHFEFSGISESKTRGAEIGNWYRFSLFAGLVGPLMGGSILLFSDFSLLFLLVGILLFGSAVPMFFCSHRNRRYDVDFKKVFMKKQIRDGLAFLGQGGVIIVAVVFWPIFVYGILGGYLKLGSLATGVGIVSILFTFIMSRLSDKYNRRKLIRIGALFHSVTWFLKMGIQTVSHLIGLYALGAITSIAANLPFIALTYDKSKNKTEYFIMREVYMSIGRVLILILILITGKLIHGFFFAGLFSLLPMLL